MKITPQDKQRFLAKVNKNPTIGNLSCWVWTGAMSGRYGTFWFGKNQIRAHRFSFLLFKGKIPSGKIVMHKCDNCLCVNPKHLKAGTQSDNLNDCVSKGRHFTQTKPERLARGKRNGAFTHPEKVRRGDTSAVSRLTEAAVIEIRKTYPRLNFTQLAKKFKVCPQTVSYAYNKITWGHI